MSLKQPHICLDDTLGIRYAILPGDPARLDRIALQMSDVKELAYNREFRSMAGTYQGTRIIAISTGIGGASCAIAVEELHNIGVRGLIRIGSCGALTPAVKVGDLILASGAVREDGASRTYVDERYPAVPDIPLLNACIHASETKSVPYHIGIVRSHDSFYIDNEDEITAYWAKRGVIGSDMETAALFTVARLRGMMAASILNNVVACGDDTSDSIGNYVDGRNAAMQGETNEIAIALQAFHDIDASRAE